MGALAVVQAMHVFEQQQKRSALPPNDHLLAICKHPF